MEDEIKLDSAQVEVSDLEQTSDRGMWRFMVGFDEYEVEVLVSGDEFLPNSDRFALARQVGARLGSFVSKAREYLRCFVDEGKLGQAGEWDPVWIEFGLSHDDLPNSFELFLSHSGEQSSAVWGVRYFQGRNGYRPYEFRRIQR